jgi:hypothetical protein
MSNNDNDNARFIKNELDFPIYATLKIDTNLNQGVKNKTDKEALSGIEILPGDSHRVTFQSLPQKSVLLTLEMDYFPSSDGVQAIKVAPGEHWWYVHHIEYRDDPDRYRIMIHYDCTKTITLSTSIDDTPMETHKDPTVIHPDEGP